MPEFDYKNKGSRVITSHGKKIIQSVEPEIADMNIEELRTKLEGLLNKAQPGEALTNETPLTPPPPPPAIPE